MGRSCWTLALLVGCSGSKPTPEPQPAVDPFGPVRVLPLAWSARALIDLPREGRAELALAVELKSEVAEVRFEAAEAVLTATAATGIGPRAIAAIDLDGDGAPELITADATGKSLTILVRSATAGFRRTATLARAESPVDLRVADLDGDGRPELISSEGLGQGGGLQLWKAEQGRLIAFGELLPIAGVERTVAGDLDGDGLPELAAVVTVEDRVAVFKNDGGGRFHLAVSVPTCHSPSSAVIAALLPDLSAPILVVACREGGLTMIRHALGTPASQAIDYPGTLYDLLAADLNGDGQVDLAGVDASRSMIAVWWSGMGSPALHDVRLGPVAMRAVDLDGDQRLDLAVTCIGDKSLDVLWAR